MKKSNLMSLCPLRALYIEVKLKTWKKMLNDLRSKTETVMMMNLKVMIVLGMMSKKVIQNAPLALLSEMLSKLSRLIDHLNISDCNQHH